MTDKDKKEYAEFRALTKAADDDESGASEKLREFIDARPWAKRIGDFHATVEGHLMNKLASGKAATLEFLCAHTDEKRQKLGYAEAGELERMLIDRMVMCWLSLILAEGYCNKIGQTVTTFKESEFAERSLTRASSRFIKASEALERYRLMVQVTKIATAKADLLEAKAAEARTNKANGAMRLLKSLTG